MPIVYVHGVAVRDHKGEAVESTGHNLLDRLIQSITWEAVRDRLRTHIAPAISKKPEEVPLIHAYWGDLAARLAWDGASAVPDVKDEPVHARLRPSRSRVLGELRRPLNQLGAQFFGDVFCYLNGRGDATGPGPISARVLDTLVSADAVKQATGEPIVVLTNSMGGQIVYDIVTYFLPRFPQYSGIKIDFWCSVAAQVGLFEEMKLFLASSPEYGIHNHNRVPFPDRNHLGVWWNVWDIDDLISYRVGDIIDGVDETAFHVGRPLLEEHIGYLQEDTFYRQFAERLVQAFAPVVKPTN